MGMSQRLELGQKQRLTQQQILEQRISLRLGLELARRVGKFEKQILKKAEFVGIDPDDPKTQYHYDILGTLVLKGAENEKSLLGQIVREKHVSIGDIEKVIVETFELQDIDMDLGTKRNVDLITLVLKNKGEFSVTVSIDKYPAGHIEQSPSFQESQTLSKIDSTKVWAVQALHGFKVIEGSVEGGIRGLICKEFIPGEVLGNFTADLESVVEVHGKEAIRRVAYAVGKMFANCLEELGGLPKDSNSLNIIVANSELGEPITRFCDVEEVYTDAPSIKRELRLMIAEFERFGEEIVRGLKDHYHGDISKFL